MEQIIIEALGGKLDGATLLMLFILGILTKRFVPWWVHEEVLEKLHEYEEAAPALLDEVQHLVDILSDEEPHGLQQPRRVRQRVRERQERLNYVVTNTPRTRQPRTRTRK